MSNLLSGLQLGRSLGVHERYAGGAFEEALRKVADAWIDWPYETWALLLAKIDERRQAGQRLPRDERDRRALGRRAGADAEEPMSDEELEARKLMATGRLDRPVAQPTTKR